ncbi:tRNA dimethylallyltransferase, mitochondrial [Grifola frondosa]|uniref:tRNA dimethylallyltransferase n=1 Tax=Grifola frondosa TaxID=5627 RepID=A0A1C7MFJ6_GRIFR|nr:tRNA dimethylallyltransferase, mitochondrial [Grifola frondosa]
MVGLQPLITICGTTGVGKSKLAVELALALSKGVREYSKHGYHGARIINADSMQVYAGMDVITNKVPVEERCGVEHLLMDYKQPGEQCIGREWIKDAMTVIDETHRRKQIPIVVGGTSYWIQHLVFSERMVSIGSICRVSSPELLDLFNALPEQPPSAETDGDLALSLHNLLSVLDPLVGQRWHWRDTRKVLRDLCIIRERRCRVSEVLSEQSQVDSKPRYRTLCFWLYAKPEALKPRLDARVDQMIELGLLKEIQELRAIASAAPASHLQSEDATSEVDTDYTLGIYQAIGYKEFHDYLSAPTPSEKAFRNAVEQMKFSTRRYAKRQVSWIRNKLLPAINASNATSQLKGEPSLTPTYLLDATELGDAWTINVYTVAEYIMRGFLDEEVLPDPLTLSQTAREMLTVPDKTTNPVAVLDAMRHVSCQICSAHKSQPFMVESSQWEAHVKSRSHRRLTTKKKGRNVYPSEERSKEDSSEGGDESQAGHEPEVKRGHDGRECGAKTL